MFREYAKKKRESVWAPFLNLLNRPDDISVNLTAWILARLACDGRQLMDAADLQFYFTWLKDQLKRPVSRARPGRASVESPAAAAADSRRRRWCCRDTFAQGVCTRR